MALDQGIPGDAAVRFREFGHDCTHVGEIGMSRARDQEIIEWAIQKNAVIITLDADFHAIIAVSGATKPSIVRLRLQGLNGDAVADTVERVLNLFRQI